MARVTGTALLLLALTVTASLAQPTKKAPAKKAPVARLAQPVCQVYPQHDDHEGDFSNYNCIVKPPMTAAPVCIRLACPGVTVGPAPIAGTGDVPDVVRPRPFSTGLSPTCTTIDPIYPGNSWYFSFLVRATTPAKVATVGFYPAVNGKC